MKEGRKGYKSIEEELGLVKQTKKCYRVSKETSKIDFKRRLTIQKWNDIRSY